MRGLADLRSSILGGTGEGPLAYGGELGWVMEERRQTV